METGSEERKVIRLEDYKKRPEPRQESSGSVIEIHLLDGENFEYSMDEFSPIDALRALIACYVVAADLLEALKGGMKW